jgi:hypothetical protein
MSTCYLSILIVKFIAENKEQVSEVDLFILCELCSFYGFRWLQLVKLTHSNGRSYKMLTVLDEYMREVIAVTVANKMGSSEVLEALYPLLLKRGKPEYLRSDNGPEFTSEPFKDWLIKVGIKPINIYPGSP